VKEIVKTDRKELKGKCSKISGEAAIFDMVAVISRRQDKSMKNSFEEEST
jgi:hypothetical protein